MAEVRIVNVRPKRTISDFEYRFLRLMLARPQIVRVHDADGHLYFISLKPLLPR